MASAEMSVRGDVDTKLIREHLAKISGILRSHEIGLRDARELREALSDQLYSLLLACDGIGVLETLRHRHGVQLATVFPEGHA